MHWSSLLPYLTLNYLMQAVGVIFGLAGNILLNKRNVRGCYYMWLVSNVAMIALQVTCKNYLVAGMYVVYLALALQGIFSWRQMPGEAALKT